MTVWSPVQSVLWQYGTHWSEDRGKDGQKRYMYSRYAERRNIRT